MAELDLEFALESAISNRTATILSCLPGRLAFFEGESRSLLLVR